MALSDEAARLPTASGPHTRSGAARLKPQRLRVRVICLADSDVLVDLTIPTSLVAVGLRLGARLTPLFGPQDTEHLLAMITAGAAGPLLDREDSDQGERVTVWIE